MTDSILKTRIFQALTHLSPILKQRRKPGFKFYRAFPNASKTIKSLNKPFQSHVPLLLTLNEFHTLFPGFLCKL